MKKIILLFAILAFATTSFAQFEGSSNKNKATLDSAKVPLLLKQSFYKENPGLEAGWRLEGKNYKAEYVDDANVAHARVYDNAGNILWRDDEMSSYPTPISDYYAKTYPGEGYMIWSRIDNKGLTRYYAYHNSEMIWFDKDGNVMNGKKKSGTPNIKMQ